MAKALEGSKIIRISGEREYELGRDGRSWFLNLGIDAGAAVFAPLLRAPVPGLD
jgi:hypothetical protein